MRLEGIHALMMATPLRPQGHTTIGRMALIPRHPLSSYCRDASSSVKARSPGLVPTPPSREAAAGKGAARARI
jgi:hypothetical protein